MKSRINLLVFVFLSWLSYAGGCNDSDPNFIIRPSTHPNACVAMELENIDATGSHTWDFNPTPIDVSTGLPLTPLPYSLPAGTTKTIYWTSAGDKDIRYDGGSWETFHNCNCNPIAADYFEDAPLICNTEFYCGTTSSAYGVDQTGLLECNGGADHEGSLENNSWLKFIADSTTATFDINVLSNCYIQFAVYAYDPTATNPDDQFVLMTDIDWTDIDVGFTGAQTITASPLTVGEEYYLHFDGHGGAECDYEIGFNSGFAAIGLDASSNLVCPGDPVTLTATPNDPSATYTWTVNGGAPFTAGATMNVNPTVTTTYTVAVTLTGCDQSPETVNVDMDVCSPLPVELTSFALECESDPELNWITVTEHESSHFEILEGNSQSDMQVIGIVDAAGYSSQQINYTYPLTSDQRTVKYYQLKQVDYDGDFEYSKVISNGVCISDSPDVDSFFDLNSGALNIVFNYPTNQQSTITVCDLNGKVLHQSTEYIDAGSTIKSILVPASSNMVIVHVSNASEYYTNRHFCR